MLLYKKLLLMTFRTTLVRTVHTHKKKLKEPGKTSGCVMPKGVKEWPSSMIAI